MSGDHHSPEEMKKHVRLYLQVGGALFLLTIITVAIGLTHIKSIALAILIGMLIASLKGGLVAAVYMHLMGEKKIIYYCLILTGLFFLFAIAIPVITVEDAVGKKVAPFVKMDSGHAHGSHGHADKHGEEAAHEESADDAAAPAEHAEESGPHAPEEAPAESH